MSSLNNNNITKNYLSHGNGNSTKKFETYYESKYQERKYWLNWFGFEMNFIIIYSLNFKLYNNIITWMNYIFISLTKKIIKGQLQILFKFYHFIKFKKNIDKNIKLF